MKNCHARAALTFKPPIHQSHVLKLVAKKRGSFLRCSQYLQLHISVTTTYVLVRESFHILASIRTLNLPVSPLSSTLPFLPSSYSLIMLRN